MAAGLGAPKGKGGVRVSPPVMEEVIGQLIAGKDELQRLSEQVCTRVSMRARACLCA